MLHNTRALLYFLTLNVTALQTGRFFYFMQKSIYIDGEWFIGGKIFLIGAVYSNGKVVQLYYSSLTRAKFLKLISGVSRIYFYGPDIGVIESHFNIRLRNKVRCFNLLKIFRQVLPPQKSYKLADIEKKHGIKRKRVEYKKNIFDIFSNWKNHEKRKRVLEYNVEDVVNLMALKRIIFKKYNVRLKDSDRLK